MLFHFCIGFDKRKGLSEKVRISRHKYFYFWCVVCVPRVCVRVCARLTMWHALGFGRGLTGGILSPRHMAI